MKKPVMTIEEWPLAAIKPYWHNAKQHNEAWIAASIKEFKPDQPIVVDAEGVIIKGHGRLAAAKRLGLETFPVYQRTDLSPDQVRLSRLADNRSAEAGWDAEKLDLSFAEIDIADLAIDPADLGLDELLTDLEKTTLVDMPDTPAPVDGRRKLQPKKIQIKPVLYAEDVQVFEQAMLAAGVLNRGQALVEICRFYLAHSGGDDGLKG